MVNQNYVTLLNLHFLKIWCFDPWGKIPFWQRCFLIFQSYISVFKEHFFWRSEKKEINQWKRNQSYDEVIALMCFGASFYFTLTHRQAHAVFYVRKNQFIFPKWIKENTIQQFVWWQICSNVLLTAFSNLGIPGSHPGSNFYIFWLNF